MMTKTREKHMELPNLTREDFQRTRDLLTMGLAEPHEELLCERMLCDDDFRNKLRGGWNDEEELLRQHYGEGAIHPDDFYLPLSAWDATHP
jgi:hypothetical protein